MTNRITTLKSKFRENKIDALLVTNPANLIYLSGYTGSNGMLIVKKNQLRPIFYTDFRYQEQIKHEVKGCVCKIWDRSLYTDFPVNDLQTVNALGFESASISYANYSRVKKQLKSKIRLIPTNGIVENLRMVKDENELAIIRKAVSITDQAFINVLKIIKPGVTEKDLACEIDLYFMRNGGIAFPTIVAFAERGALPHAKLTNKKLKNGDAIVFDIGAKFENYCADMTRTVVLGKASNKVKEIYNIVLTAQQMAQNEIQAGKPAREIDWVARDYIKSNGYSKYFGHGLGHGVGLMVHELPSVSSKSNDTLKINQVFSVEPGIYLPNKFGVRIEDLVIVNPKGSQILTKSPKELIEL